MSKRTKARKTNRQAIAEARRITPGKLLRLFLKTFPLVILFSVLFTLADVYGVPYVGNFWVQVGVLVAVVLLAYPFLYSEFRPKHYMRKEERKSQG